MQWGEGGGGNMNFQYKIGTLFYLVAVYLTKFQQLEKYSAELYGCS